MKLLFPAILWLALGGQGMAEDPWDAEPVRYSARVAQDTASLLERGLADGSLSIPGESPLERMRWVLAKLDIPEESQVLVFSKTSKQNHRITPGTPRAIYFSENTYAAYVPGGDMEIIAHDPALGPVFHLLALGSGREPAISHRATDDCLSCHGNARTQEVPGMLVRSVFPGDDGRPHFSLGSTDVNDATPLTRRWGGYYVTGRSALPHFGNRTFSDERPPQPAGDGILLTNVADRIPASAYPRATSDIVALLLLEHQCHVSNLITAASHRLRREDWMRGVLNLNDTSSRVVGTDAVTIADALLFRDAADLGDGVEGDEGFQTAFHRRFPVTRDGRSLADFHLGRRLFKSRCSYMVYSEVFSSMPVLLRQAVLGRMREILTSITGVEGYDGLKAPERQRINAILTETLPAYREP